MIDIQSYPTPAGLDGLEIVNPGFLKLHPAPPIHYFTHCVDEEFHDHIWDFTSHVVIGGYVEQVAIPNPDGTWTVETITRRPGTTHQMPAWLPHKLVSLLDGPCITRCEYGPPYRKWGVCKFDANGVLWHRAHDEGDWTVYRAEEMFHN